MKNLKFGFLAILAFLACVSSAWASYIITQGYDALYLSQANSCSGFASAYCGNDLKTLVDTYWANPSSTYPLVLTSDIDLQELNADGTCSQNHKPLNFSNGANATFDGNGFAIKNMCYEWDIGKDGAMTAPVGFFGTIDGKQVQKVKFSNVRMVVKDTRSNRNSATAGVDYYPVGVLAGFVNMSYVYSGSVENVVLKAPFAGGLVGYASSSTVKNFIIEENVLVTNTLEISNAPTNFAGKSFAEKVNPMMWGSRYAVFLGGVAGAAHHVTFDNLSVHVSVADSSSANTPSALGGVAGMFTYAGSYTSNPSELSVTIDNVRLVRSGSESSSATSLYGGSAMGGLFGETNIYGDSREVGKLTIQNTLADVYIRGATSDSVFVGGLVGRSDPPLGSSLLFDNNQVFIDLKDTVIPNINQKYFAGGMVGYFGRINGGNADSASFPTFKNSTAKGLISVDGNPSSTGMKADAVNLYLGGFAGVSFFTWNGHGLSYDTSYVSMSSKATGVDTVFAGGFVGFTDVDGNGGTETLSPRMIYENDVFKGSISIAEDVNATFVGGIVGLFSSNSGNKSIYFNNVAVEGENDSLISVENAAMTDGARTTSIGGICGFCMDVKSASKMSVVGDISVTGSMGSDSVLVGGLFGQVFTYRNVDINNTFSRGNVTAPTGANAGYLMGVFFGADSLTATYNYHYGDKDAVAPFGAVVRSGWPLDVGDGLTDSENKYIFKYNVRNGETNSLNANTNGTMLKGSMRRSAFAGIMNTDQDPYVWTYASNLNDGLPFFADANHAAIAPSSVQSFMVTFLGMNGQFIAQQTVQVGMSAIAPTAPDVIGYTFEKWNADFSAVFEPMMVKAVYKKNVYEISFMNGGSLVAKNFVEYGVTPTAPDVKVPDATTKYTYSFAGWTPEIEVATENATYTAVFDSIVNKYEIAFVNEDGSELQKSEVEYDAVPSYNGETPAKKATAQYTYTFKGWDKAFAFVTGAATYTAVFDSTINTFTVSFYDYDLTLIEEQKVNYAESAKAPNVPSREDADGIAYAFKGWNADFSKVVEDMMIVALYDGSVISSSSSEDPGFSSSSVDPGSSSSSNRPLEIVSPRIDQSGNAIRLTFGTNNFDVANKTSARVIVLGDEGVYMDSVLTDSITDAAARGEWLLSPAPIGKFTVKLLLASDVASDSCEKVFNVSGEIEVQPRSWQMIALSALDMAALRDKEDAAFYWWDEENPIGDYWQYRAYEETAEYNETQGFWYGTKDGNPLKLKAETPTKDAEIVWELDNRYSGWNLVANPHGWYVNMQGAEDCGAEFWRWNSLTSEYEPVSVLAPYEAIWAKVDGPTTCRISSVPDFSIAMDDAEETEILAKKTLAKATSGMDWSFRAVLSDANGKRDSWNVLGAGNGGNMEKAPSGMGDHVNLSIVEGKSRFARFVKPAADFYSWNLEVKASSARDGFLFFEGLESVVAKGMKVFVTIDGKMTEMTNGKSVPVSLKKDSKTVTVQVSKSAPVVSSNALKGLRAVQQGGSLQIGFTADGMNGSQGLVQLVGVNGKIAATSKFTAVGGANLVTVAAPKSGVYFLRVKVGSQMTSAKFLVK